MTDHTYAGYTAKQIRAAAMAATPSSEWQFEHRNVEIKFRVRSGIQALFPLSRCHNVLNAEVRANVAHIEMCQPATVLALLDRISELDKQQRKMTDDVTVIQRIHGEQKAALYGKLAELEADNSEYEAFVNECRFMSPGDDVPLHGLADRMRADKRALRIDAERYRWVRDKVQLPIDGECGDATLPSRMCCAEEVDTAIDAARAAEQKNPAAP